MPSEFTPEIEHNFLESDMRRLAAEVQKHRERPENRAVSDEALIKKSLAVFTPTENAPASPPAGPGPLPTYTQAASPETRLEIEYLLDLAFHQGIEKANAAARQSSPFVLDAFHDTLVGKLYPELQKKGIVK